MATNTELLQQLAPGTEMAFLADAGALQAAKMGLLIVAILLCVAGLYLFLTQLGILGGVKKSIFAWGGAALAILFSFLLYQKQEAYSHIDLTTPYLVVNREALTFPQENLSLKWDAIEDIKLEENARQPRQATTAIRSYEVRILLKTDKNDESAAIIARADKPDSGYHAINFEILNVDPHLLAAILKSYKEGLQ